MEEHRWQLSAVTVEAQWEQTVRYLVVHINDELLGVRPFQGFSAAANIKHSAWELTKGSNRKGIDRAHYKRWA